MKDSNVEAGGSVDFWKDKNSIQSTLWKNKGFRRLESFQGFIVFLPLDVMGFGSISADDLEFLQVILLSWAAKETIFTNLEIKKEKLVYLQEVNEMRFEIEQRRTA